jgi:NusA-like protein
MTSGEGRLRNLNRIVEQVSKEKGLDRSIVVSALEEAMLSAAAMSCSRSCHPRSWAARAHVAPKRAEETALAAAAEAVAGARRSRPNRPRRRYRRSGGNERRQL